MKNILVVNVNWLGDVIFSSAVFAALKDRYPQARLCCLVVPRVADVARQIPFVDDVIVYDEKGRDRFLMGKLKLIVQLRARHFDSAFLLHGSWTRALLVFLAGIPVRVGYDIKGRGKFLTHRVEAPEGMVHRSDLYLNIVESYCGPSSIARTTCVQVTAADTLHVKEKLVQLGISKDDFMVLMHVGGNWPLKRWPVENFIRLSDILSEKLKAKVVICGGASEQDLGDKILARAAHKPVLLIGQTSFRELAALMKCVNIVVSADSGPLHIASSVGTSVVGLFGPTHPDVTGPRGLGKKYILHPKVGCNIKPCYHDKCQDNICMKAISVKDVVEQIEKERN